MSTDDGKERAAAQMEVQKHLQNILNDCAALKVDVDTRALEEGFIDLWTGTVFDGGHKQYRIQGEGKGQQLIIAGNEGEELVVKKSENGFTVETQPKGM